MGIENSGKLAQQKIKQFEETMNFHEFLKNIARDKHIKINKSNLNTIENIYNNFRNRNSSQVTILPNEENRNNFISRTLSLESQATTTKDHVIAEQEDLSSLLKTDNLIRDLICEKQMQESANERVSQQSFYYLSQHGFINVISRFFGQSANQKLMKKVEISKHDIIDSNKRERAANFLKSFLTYSIGFGIAFAVCFATYGLSIYLSLGVSAVAFGVLASVWNIYERRIIHQQTYNYELNYFINLLLDDSIDQRKFELSSLNTRLQIIERQIDSSLNRPSVNTISQYSELKKKLSKLSTSSLLNKNLSYKKYAEIPSYFSYLFNLKNIGTVVVQTTPTLLMIFLHPATITVLGISLIGTLPGALAFAAAAFLVFATLLSFNAYTSYRAAVRTKNIADMGDRVSKQITFFGDIKQLEIDLGNFSENISTYLKSSQLNKLAVKPAYNGNYDDNLNKEKEKEDEDDNKLKYNSSSSTFFQTPNNTVTAAHIGAMNSTGTTPSGSPFVGGTAPK